jgi:hypothetical protein
MGAIFPYSTAYESRESPKNAIIKTSLKKKKNYKNHGFLHHNHDTIYMFPPFVKQANWTRGSQTVSHGFV